MKKNDILTLDIERLGGEAGIAHADGLTVFVQNALPGEMVRAQIQKVAKTHAFGKTFEVVISSPERAVPPCPHFDKCGGCACQHMTYALSLEMKRTQVQDAFQRIGGIAIDVPPVLGMDDPWHYRNKTTLPVGGTSAAPQIGFFAPRSHRIIDIDTCLIAKSESDTVGRVVRLWMQKFSIAPYQEESRVGIVRHVMSRVSKAGEVMAVLVATTDHLPHQAELIAMLRAALPGLVSVCLNVNKRADNVILGDSFRVLYGTERLNDTLCGLRFSLSPLSFFQINPTQTEVLYQTALAFAGLTGDELVADLYCGAGTISLMLAQKARQVIGIEIVPDAIHDAQQNAINNGIPNAEFHAGAAEELLPKLVEQGLRLDVIVLDPPRKGLEPPVIAAILAAAPQRIVYVSCDPATQARDVKMLAEGGYTLQKVQPVDMFCHTAHVENVALLVRKQ